MRQQATFLSQQAEQKNEQWVCGCAWKLGEWRPTLSGEKERLNGRTWNQRGGGREDFRGAVERA